MTSEEAVKKAHEWVAVRTEVRQHLIVLARVKNPVKATEEWPSNEVRKLWQYPSDLSVARLLNLTGE